MRWLARPEVLSHIRSPHGSCLLPQCQVFFCFFFKWYFFKFFYFILLRVVLKRECFAAKPDLLRKYNCKYRMRLVSHCPVDSRVRKLLLAVAKIEMEAKKRAANTIRTHCSSFNFYLEKLFHFSKIYK